MSILCRAQKPPFYEFYVRPFRVPVSTCKKGGMGGFSYEGQADERLYTVHYVQDSLTLLSVL